MSNKQLHTRTPTVVVLDNRGSTIREINYCRHPDAINQTDERITRHHFHARGYLERSIDARLYETQQSDSTIQPNIQQTVSLGGLLSAIKSVDSGNSFNISDIENKKVMDINGLGLVTEYHYTKPEFVSQLIAIMESSPTSKQILKERFTWGEADNKNIANNSVGKCTHHDFLAGRTEYGAYALTGQSLIELRFITANANTVKIPAHSQYQTRNIYDATGQLLKQIDASGHEREWQYDRAGFLKQSSVQLHSDKKQLVIKAINYSAAGQKLRVEHGNGIVTTYEYEAETQRLLHVKTQRPQGHVLGAKIMQDLRYEYDPVGNIICLKNDAEATRYWRNQKIVPENRYVYDSLYQLVSATGRESANQKTPASMQSQQITTRVKDTQSYTNYTRLYTYDSGGNLVQLRHLSGIAQQSFTQNICVSNKTNRALLETQQVAIEQIDQQFDALGNQKHLSTGDALQWDLRGTLAQVNKRGNSEHYVYASASQRLMKQQVQRLSERHIITETHYLPNLEIWQSTQGGHLTEHREVVDITGNVRALCWKVGLPKGIKNNQLRYSYDDGVGNSGLETDGQGQLVSYEEYYPYGGTAIWSSENAVEANYKTIRYSGKEKDATGLYYYGYRYYQPWIGHWLSADPAGTIDGLNLYRMVRNNPVTLRDPDGLAPLRTIDNLSKEDLKDIKKSISEMKNSTRVILSDNEKIHQKSRGFAEVQAKYHEEFASHKGLPVSILDEEDKGIIRLYSRNQIPFNSYLKQGISIDSGINGNAKKLENALSKMANATEISYRGYGIPKGAWDNLSPGELVTNDVFMSTSLSISYAKIFTERFSQGREGVMLKVMGRTGKNISLLSRFQGENGESEILFSPNSTFNIMAIKKHRKINYAIVREVKNNPDQKRSIYDGRLLQPPIHESAWTPMS
ncbi:RHS repeat-associated core domain-containing protein [Proteus hauseri]|uniref:RHS repeat-associated core domain-containing protein n=1 Tax=Proteus hauseri TaxID=183417 RepID=UPI0013E9801C|nr:RHS repeat-associated core domain-containing protein [Proteus hauseri]